MFTKDHSTNLKLFKMFQLEHDNKLKVYKNRESTIKDALVHNKEEPSYWTEYNRNHSLLGAVRGPGEPKEYQDRASYNVITGLTLFDKFFTFFCIISIV